MARQAPTDPLSSMDPDAYRELMRHQAGAVTVIATGTHDNRGRSGLTATAVASLSDTPPTILACVQQRLHAHTLIEELGVFSVNILNSNQQDIAEKFAGKTKLSGEGRFSDDDWGLLVTGAPVLAGALACLDCRLLECHRFATHSIFIGSVVAGKFRKDSEPLLYYRGDYWQLS